MREWGVGDKRGMRGRGMREARLSAVSAAVMLLGSSGAAYAADLGNMVTKAPPALPGPATCTSIDDFFTTACQLSWNGVRFYGTVDVGGGYETNGAPFAKFAGAGVNYFLGKPNLGGKWLPSPNALSQSTADAQVGSRSAFIVPARAGNQARWDPKEGREALWGARVVTSSPTRRTAGELRTSLQRQPMTRSRCFRSGTQSAEAGRATPPSHPWRSGNEASLMRYSGASHNSISAHGGLSQWHA